ncbi:MAG: hypothetical protein Q4D37_11385 [Oscillospiraceae bacterium]|nr:hypothetical protein [Oscillospiraceae bacterium]
MTATRTAPTDMERLIHAALDVAVPFERYSWLRGFIEGYQAKEKEFEAGFAFQNGNQMQQKGEEHERNSNFYK